MNRQYIGARYVPKFYEGTNGTEWDSGVAYEPLTIVTYLGNSYTSKIPVPAGVGSPNNNPSYWASTGIYSAQVEEYREETESVKARVDIIEPKVNSHTNEYRKFIFIGDSICEGYNPDGNVDGWGTLVPEYLNLDTDQYETLAVGGTAFLEISSNSFLTMITNYRNTLTDAEAETFTDIIVVGGVNEKNANNFSEANVVTAIKAFATYVKTNFPNAKLSIGCSALNIRPTDVYALQQTRSAYSNACGEIGCNEIGQVLNSFHAINMFGSDNLHLNQTGQEYLSRYLAKRISGSTADAKIDSIMTITIASAWGGETRNINTFLTGNVISAFFSGFFLNHGTDVSSALDGNTFIEVGSISGGTIIGDNYGSDASPNTTKVFTVPALIQCQTRGWVLGEATFRIVGKKFYVAPRLVNTSGSGFETEGWSKINVNMFTTLFTTTPM